MTGSSVHLSADLLRQGFGYKELSRLRTSGEVARVRRGAYTWTTPEDGLERHRQLIAGSLPMLSAGTVISHYSAAVLHGLPSWTNRLKRVHVIQERIDQGRIGAVMHVHPMVLPSDEISMIDGVAVTSLARTVADCARLLPYADGVAVGDAALRLGMSREELMHVLTRKPRRVGNPLARRVAAFLDERSESVGESRSRVQVQRALLPPPELQFEIIDPRTGEVVARCDFGWRDQRTIGEFDGKVKYGRLLTPGQSAGDVVYAEKLREDRIRDLGYSVVRWTNDDLDHFERVATRLRRAFARGL